MGSCVQVALGLTGSAGLLLRFVGPLTVAPAVTLLGLVLVQIAVDMSGLHWGVAAMYVLLYGTSL